MYNFQQSYENYGEELENEHQEDQNDILDQMRNAQQVGQGGSTQDMFAAMFAKEIAVHEKQDDRVSQK